MQLIAHAESIVIDSMQEITLFYMYLLRIGLTDVIFTFLNVFIFSLLRRLKIFFSKDFFSIYSSYLYTYILIHCSVSCRQKRVTSHVIKSRRDGRRSWMPHALGAWLW